MRACRHGVSEVDLVGVASLDVILDALDLRGVLVFSDRELGVRCESGRDWLGGWSEVWRGAFEAALCVIEDEWLSVDAEPRKRELRQHWKFVEAFEVITALVAQVSGDVMALCEGELDAAEEIGDVV